MVVKNMGKIDFVYLSKSINRFCAMVNNPAKFKNMVSCFLRF